MGKFLTIASTSSQSKAGVVFEKTAGKGKVIKEFFTDYVATPISRLFSKGTDATKKYVKETSAPRKIVDAGTAGLVGYTSYNVATNPAMPWVNAPTEGGMRDYTGTPIVQDNTYVHKGQPIVLSKKPTVDLNEVDWDQHIQNWNAKHKNVTDSVPHGLSEDNKTYFYVPDSVKDSLLKKK